MASDLVAVALLIFASIVATLSTERAQPRLDSRMGWPASLALAIAAGALFARGMGAAEAAAVVVVYLMAGIPAASLLMALRHRKSKRQTHDR